MTAPIEYSAQLRIPASGPMFDGHFPGHPVLPGARLLDLVIAAIGADCDGDAIAGAGTGTNASAGAGASAAVNAGTEPLLQVHVAKFLAPVAPGTVLQLAWRVQTGGRISFECRDGTRRVASGTLSRGAAQRNAPAQEPQR